MWLKKSPGAGGFWFSWIGLASADMDLPTAGRVYVPADTDLKNGLTMSPRALWCYSAGRQLQPRCAYR